MGWYRQIIVVRLLVQATKKPSDEWDDLDGEDVEAWVGFVNGRFCCQARIRILVQAMKEPLEEWEDRSGEELEAWVVGVGKLTVLLILRLL